MYNDEQQTEGQVTRWITFNLDGEIYGIEVMKIREVLRSQDIAPVPGAPSYVMGIINLRGNVVAIIDTRTRFGLPTREDVDDATRIIILESGNLVVGFMVDSVSEVVELDDSNIQLPPDTGRGPGSQFIKGLYNHRLGLLILLDTAKLLSEEELAEVASI